MAIYTRTETGEIVKVNIPMLKGADGARGPVGAQGPKGETGVVDYSIVYSKTEANAQFVSLQNAATLSFPTLNTTNKTIVGAINELLQEIMAGKALIVSALETKGVTVEQDDFPTLAQAITDLTD